MIDQENIDEFDFYKFYHPKFPLYAWKADPICRPNPICQNPSNFCAVRML